MEKVKNKRVLVCPLDWGLGHATRSVPVIRELLSFGCEVIIGADGRPLELLKQEFPGLEFVVLKGYDIRYPKDGAMVLSMALQFRKIRSRIHAERKELDRLIGERHIGLVISDNRFGLWTRRVPCIYITHQVMIKCPPGLRFLEPLLYRMHRSVINHYKACWIPDYSDTTNLSGDLSHKYPLPPHAAFIGPLSRFASPVPVPKKYELLVLLSGPEPQRSLLEQIILPQLKNTTHKTLVVRGLPEGGKAMEASGHVEIKPHLSANQLQRAIAEAERVISRPGYSTIMDLAVMGKKAIFIPTPGQTEQEYLAEKMMKEKICFSMPQRRFDLKSALEKSKDFSGFVSFQPEYRLRDELEKWM